ncbi:hypothetical protein AB0I81_29275 [Nonomuraea sp. NPDC050404]|uniref:hypothetical protein n=1 Tax=Nonomuraea sp. NPDC050404 TaxID=3155783 RepID=UPI0033E9D866
MNPISRLARRRRPLAIAAAVTVIGGGFLAVHPALADRCEPEQEIVCPDEGSEPVWEETGGTEPEEEPTVEEPTAEDSPGDYDSVLDAAPAVQDEPGPWGPKIRAAINLTGWALENRRECDDAVSGRAGRASTVFAALVEDRRILNYTDRTNSERPGSPASAAGRGTGGTIYLFRPWLSAQAATDFHRGSGVRLNDDGWRAVILLHELGHLTRGLASDHSNMRTWEPRALARCLL